MQSVECRNYLWPPLITQSAVGRQNSFYICLTCSWIIDIWAPSHYSDIASTYSNGSSESVRPRLSLLTMVTPACPPPTASVSSSRTAHRAMTRWEQLTRWWSSTYPCYRCLEMDTAAQLLSAIVIGVSSHTAWRKYKQQAQISDDFLSFFCSISVFAQILRLILVYQYTRIYIYLYIYIYEIYSMQHVISNLKNVCTMSPHGRPVCTRVHITSG